jgi:hypothetical protein
MYNEVILLVSGPGNQLPLSLSQFPYVNVFGLNAITSCVHLSLKMKTESPFIAEAWVEFSIGIFAVILRLLETGGVGRRR